MTEAQQPVAFGLIVIGDEVLNGDRVDGHFSAFRRMIQARGHELAWHWLLPDDPETLAAQLSFSMARPHPVFCCGGIGATPDDHTRACAAEAAGVGLRRHPGAQALLEEKFGPEVYPNRILMADLPDEAALIPNPINQIPGFAIRGHWFLPGFPKMAWPMAEWVLDQHYGSCSAVAEDTLVVRGVPESRLIPLMERLGRAYPDLKLFSLPHMGENPHILLGFRGRGALAPAMADLRAALAEAGITDVETRLGH
ncbi:competence/damage-inducible protein A [Thiorhodococcus minor]|uniref:Competence/damage-inducible protein A n=1 Tax=Thiorhodococcus minor TaxID=57489 RepID=A0A6M0K1Y8_9GAMM|nr:molybdopterin-binding protein [Thiorhodococcus minor]NEV63766.1 competence/damage-inducible protein A [Thiorhodococcus minor]